MNIHICRNQEEWDSWFFLHKEHEFLQSWEWGRFQENTGKKVLRMQIMREGEVVDQVQGFVHKLGPGLAYVYLPRVGVSGEDSLQAVFQYLKKNAYAFARLEPAVQILDSSFSYRETDSRQPRHTLLLDTTETQEELLAGMHTKTRYNIRLAEKKGVSVKREKNSEVFWLLNRETSARDRFKSHEKTYYEKMIGMDACHQLVAYYEDVPIASNLLVAYGGRLTYLHGASSNAHRNAMAPYLLQWEGLRLAQELDCRTYDFWGIAPPASEDGAEKTTCFHRLCWRVDDPWTGITRFKAGFGGNAKTYPQAVEVPLHSWKYRAYTFVKKLR